MRSTVMALVLYDELVLAYYVYAVMKLGLHEADDYLIRCRCC